MALQFEDITAWIASEGVGVQVHRIEKLRQNHLTCWIVSKAGKSFSVNWRSDTRTFPLQGTVTIDGLECNNHVMLDARTFPNRPNSVEVSYVRTSEYTQRDFMFAAVQRAGTDDDDGFPNDGSRDHLLGTIKLELYRLHVVGVVSQPSQYIPNATLESQSMREDPKTVGQHQIRYGEEYRSPAPIVDIVSGCRIGSAPYVTFTFKYRPLETLLARGIVTKARKFKIILDPATEIRQLEASIGALRSKGTELHGGRGTPYLGQDGKGKRGEKKPRRTREGKVKLTSLSGGVIEAADSN